MHKIIEQAAVLCGMVKTPNPKPATKETAANGQYRHRPRRTQEPHRRNEARSEAQPQAQDAHRAARLRRTLADRDLPRSLLLAHHRVCGRIPLPPGGAGGLRRPPKARPEAVGLQEEGARARQAPPRRRLAHLSWLAALALELQAYRPPTSEGAGSLREPADT